MLYDCTLMGKKNEKKKKKKLASENFPWFPGFRICFMAKNENPETPEINRKLSKSKKHPVLTIYRC